MTEFDVQCITDMKRLTCINAELAVSISSGITLLWHLQGPYLIDLESAEVIDGYVLLLCRTDIATAPWSHVKEISDPSSTIPVLTHRNNDPFLTRVLEALPKEFEM